MEFTKHRNSGSLTTPAKIRTLQRKLYCKAKAEPAFRFHQLYDKVWRKDILAHAWSKAKANGGAAGVDGVTFAMVEEQGVDAFLAGLADELQTKAYRPQAVRRVLIPKPGGGKRPLGIPTIRDRVVQTAVKLVIEPIFEADFEPNSYGYRPRRSARGAVEEIHILLRQGYTDVVDADLSQYFDTIPHDELIECVARRIVDRHILRLIKMWLRVPVEERDGKGKRRITGGKKTRRGTPQGGVVSPLLANLYMNRFLKHWRITGRGKAFRAHVVSYADDFAILSRGSACQALAWTAAVMEKLGLKLNEDKTSLKNARIEQFDFLGYTFGPHRSWKTGRIYQGASPSKRSVKRLKDKVGDILVPGNQAPWPEVRDQLNAVLRGWSNYFGYGARARAYRAVDNHVLLKARRFLKRRHKKRGRGTGGFTTDVIFGRLGVLHLRTKHFSKTSCALR